MHVCMLAVAYTHPPFILPGELGELNASIDTVLVHGYMCRRLLIKYVDKNNNKNSPVGTLQDHSRSDS